MRLRFIQLCGILVVLVPFLGLPGVWKDPLLWFLGAAIVVLGYYESNGSYLRTSSVTPVASAPATPDTPPPTPKPILPEYTAATRPTLSPRPRRMPSVRVKSSARNEAPKIQ